MPNEPGKPDFSNVQSGSESSAPSAPAAPDFSNVQAGSETSAPTANEVQTYKVVSGDSLSKIAQKFYGHANRWREIFEANRDQISNPDRIKVGQVLKIPAAGDKH
ncbi:MAG TPA: LysM peptidoglycan-binding domain-containing protein [Rudaea sp.]|nr:LysM peptidoglycan-binding domain-containing protein [Rudaea sp.]